MTYASQTIARLTFRRFPLGRIATTPAALHLLAKVGKHPFELLARHAVGDTDLSPEDKQVNEAAIATGGQIFSSFTVGRTPQGVDLKLWIVTDPGRTSTVLLTPKEY